MKRHVIRSINDQTGLRCLDLVQSSGGSVTWLECRRDPEDSFGWRVIGYSETAFPDAGAALADARGAVGWLEEGKDIGV